MAESITLTTDSLWQKLTAFPLDDPTADLSFSERLARENLWSLTFASRVVEEYRRFLYLAATAGHTVTPSDHVDQAWHLHLVYTRSYWEDLCGMVLGRPLHHGPTRGGRKESRHYQELYQQTLESYAAAFGTPPPTDIWPGTDERFRQSAASVRVDRGRYWLLPRLTTRRLLITGCSGATLLPLGFVLDPILNLRGPEFLLVYLILLVSTLGIVFGLQWWMRGDEVEDRKAEQLAGGLTSSHAGYLLHGASGALQAALTALRGAGVVGYGSDRFRAVADSSLEVKDRFIQHVGQTLQSNRRGLDWRQLMQASRLEFARLSVDLEEMGLLVPQAQRVMLRGLMSIPMAALLLLGALKLHVGLQRDRPIGLLVLLMIASVVVFTVCLWKTNRRSRSGQRVANFLTERFTTPKKSDDAGSIAPEHLAWYGAIGGGTAIAALSTDHDSLFYDQIFGATKKKEWLGDSGWSGWDGGGGGSSGCGGDSGCGGGGCGGGGCGGCGGCGG